MPNTCYGVDTTRIKRMSEVLRGLNVDFMSLKPEEFAAYARIHRKELSRMVEMYLDMTTCFLEVMRAVAVRTLELERQAPTALSQEGRAVDRRYLEGFLPIYDRASERSIRLLRKLLKAWFARDPLAQAAFVAQVGATGKGEVQCGFFIDLACACHRCLLVCGLMRL